MYNLKRKYVHCANVNYWSNKVLSCAIVPLSGVQVVAGPVVAEAPVGVKGAEQGAGSGSSADTPAGLYFLVVVGSFLAFV